MSGTMAQVLAEAAPHEESVCSGDRPPDTRVTPTSILLEPLRNDSSDYLLPVLIEIVV